MAEPTPPAGDVFDVNRIRKLVELMDQHELTEIDLRDAEVRIRLRKGHEAVFAPAAAPQPQFAAPTAATGAPPAERAAAESEHVVVIKSIMVGTFFTSPGPESPPFVKVGDHIGEDTTVCIIEAMKVFNPIPAGVSGRILAVLAENGDPVEWDQPLFKVDTRG
jgi:acetyl-CoA carboxylase biotin carboxyl carrier protein